MLTTNERAPVRLKPYPHPFQAGFSICSDIDSASLGRFQAIHALFCSHGLVGEGSSEWKALGLSRNSRWYDKEVRGLPGLGLPCADSFFLFRDATTFGMFRRDGESNRFVEDQQEGQNCAKLLREWLKGGAIDCFHAFLHYPRREVEPVLQDFYDWCEREEVSKPVVWTNHSAAVTPSGICPNRLQPHPLMRLVRVSAKNLLSPVLGLPRYPLRHALARYQGDNPGSPYYINDLLAQNGLRYVWLNCGDVQRNAISLPMHRYGEQLSILRPVEMDDGIRYYWFERCYGKLPHAKGEGIYLADSEYGYDSSRLISERNLQDLCALGGTCILTTHWTHFRSLPLSDETIGRFRLLRDWYRAGKIWVAPTSRMLEWTRRRTFLDYTCRRQGKTLLIEIQGVNDPIFGYERLAAEELQGIAFQADDPELAISVAVNGELLTADQVQRAGANLWLANAGDEAQSLSAFAPLNVSKTV